MESRPSKQARGLTDAAGERTSLTYPGGHQASYAYTARGQLASVTDWNSKQTSYTYDNAGRLTGVTRPNGVGTTLGYDTADRLTSIVHAAGSTNPESIGYTLDAVGNRTQMADEAGTTTFGYDALNRLTSAGYPNGDATSYTLDPVGNRASQTVNGVKTSNTFDAADRMTASGSTSFTYDNNGNELTKTAGGATTTYSYDLLNRLTGISGPTTATYRYNGDGLRVGKTVNGATTTYAWDPTGLGTVLSDGNEYVWGNGLVSQVSSSSTTYAQSDGLGSIRLLTDASGNVVGRQQYDAYGGSRSQSGVQLPFQFTGEQQDAESGLVYLRARYYDPGTGRFLSTDPLGGQVAGSPYAYAADDPLGLTDPSGQFSVEPGAAGPVCTVGWGCAPNIDLPAPAPPASNGDLIASPQEPPANNDTPGFAPPANGPDAPAPSAPPENPDVPKLTIPDPSWAGGGSCPSGGNGSGSKVVASTAGVPPPTTPGDWTGKSPDPYVADIANMLEDKYGKGYVQEINERLVDSSGTAVVELDIVTQNAIIEVTRRPRGMLNKLIAKRDQLEEITSGRETVYDKTGGRVDPSSLSNRPIIAYSPNLGSKQMQDINDAGFVATNDWQQLVDVVHP